MKHLKYFLFALLVVTSNVFAFSNTKFVNQSNVCIWTSMPGDVSNYDAYPIYPGQTHVFDATTLLSSCPPYKGACTANLSYSMVNSTDGNCTYGRSNIHPIHVQVWWDNAIRATSYTKLGVNSSNLGPLFFDAVGDMLKIQGQMK